MKKDNPSKAPLQFVCAGRRVQIKELVYSTNCTYYTVEGSEDDLLEAGLVARHQLPAPRPHCKWTDRREKVKVNRVLKTYRPANGGLRVSLDAIAVAKLDSEFQTFLASLTGRALAP